jgi:hypothetical protein
MQLSESLIPVIIGASITPDSKFCTALELICSKWFCYIIDFSAPFRDAYLFVQNARWQLSFSISVYLVV